MTPDANMFREATHLLFGHEWQRATARALGPNHPDGPRDEVDLRLVRRWAAGHRDIPAWVFDTLVLLLHDDREASLAHAEAAGKMIGTLHQYLVAEHIKPYTEKQGGD